MQPFESHRPATLDEVLAVLGRSSSTKVLAGARDLFPALLSPASFRSSGFIGRGARAPAPCDHRAHLVCVPERGDGADERRAPR